MVKKEVKNSEGLWTKKDWNKAGGSFRRILRVHVEEIKKLADARTYRDLYLEDGIKPPC